MNKRLDKIEDIEPLEEEVEIEYIDDLSKVPEPKKVRKNIRKVGKASRMAKRTFNILLSNANTISVDVQDDFTISEMIDVIANELDMYQYEIWSLCRLHDDEVEWLDPKKTVAKIGLQELDRLSFRVKYYKTYFKLVDAVALDLYYSQIKLEVTSGKDVLSQKLAVQLGSLIMQIKYGDFNRGQHKKGFLKRKDFIDMFPDAFLKSIGKSMSSLEQKIYFHYRKLKGMDANTSKHQFLEKSKRLVGWGSNWFKVDCSDSSFKWLGITESGFVVQNTNDPTLYEFHGFTEVEYELEDNVLTIHVKKDDTSFNLKISTDYTQNVEALINGYLYILFKQNHEGLDPSLAITKPLDCPPYWKFARPFSRKDKEKDEASSSLDTLKSTYSDLCKQENKVEVPRFVIQIEDRVEKNEPLKELDLRRCHLSDADLDLIIKAIDTTLRQVGEEDQHLVATTILMSMNELKSGKSIGKLSLMLDVEELDLRSNDIDQDGALELSNYLKECRNLKRLIIDDNHIMIEGAIKILKSISRLSHLEEISIINCGIRNDNEELMDIFSKELGKVLSSSKRISSFAIQDNVISDRGVLGILKQIDACTHFTSINLGNIFLGSSSGVQVAEWLSKLFESKNRLKQLKLSFNAFPKPAFEHLNAMLNSKRFQVKDLDLGYMKLPRDTLMSLFESSKTNPHLESLIVSGNVIDKKALPHLVDCLEENKTIKRLGLRNCEIEKATSLKIAKILASNNVVEDLDYAGNDLESMKCCEMWGKMLLINNTLKRVNLAACQIQKESIGYFASALSKNRCLEIFHLDGNTLSVKQLKSLASGLVKNEALKVLSLQDVGIGVKDILTFLNILKDQKTLETLDVRKNASIKKTQEALDRIKSASGISVII